MTTLGEAVMAAGFLFICIALVGSGDLQEAKAEQANYCEMVSLFKKTNGEYGWPDYKGTFERCK